MKDPIEKSLVVKRCAKPRKEKKPKATKPFGRSPHVPRSDLLYTTTKEMIFPEELIRLLQHWKESRSLLNDVELNENLNCARDLVEILKTHGWVIDPELWKK